MKYLLLALLCLGLAMPWAFGQKAIRDDAIRFQQERMVFKQWDKNKFEPEPGFLYLNPLYWLTWGLHPNYPKTDLRPLGPFGPQTQRLGLVMAMQQSNQGLKLHADTLRNTALRESYNYLGAVSALDPLWMLYYSREFEPLLQQQQDGELLLGLDAPARDYLIRSGLLSWYQEERASIRERLSALRSADVDRGSRILAYHRMLGEFRVLRANFEAKKQRAKLYLSMAERADQLRSPLVPAASVGAESDKQIADRILSSSKL